MNDKIMYVSPSSLAVMPKLGDCELLQNVTELLEINSRYNITKKLQVMWFAHKRICVSLDSSFPHYSDTQHPAFCGCLKNVEK